MILTNSFFLSSPSKYQFSTTGGVLWHNLIWRYIFFLLFLGDLKNEGSVLEWLLSSDNRELDDAIEAVNEKMLSKLLQTTPFMAVFFCKFSFWLYTKKIKYFAHLIQQLILKIVFDQLGKVIYLCNWYKFTESGKGGLDTYIVMYPKHL